MFSSSAIRSKCFAICFLAVFIFICISYRNISFDLKYNMYSIGNIKTKVNVVHSKDPLYYVENSQCKIPYINPFAAEVMKIYKPKVYETCTNESDLVRPIFDTYRKLYVLHINSSFISEILNSSEIKYTCYYQEITYHDTNGLPFINNFMLQSPVYFQHGYEVPPHVQALILNCHEIGKLNNILQIDGFAFIQYKPFRSVEEGVETGGTVDDISIGENEGSAGSLEERVEGGTTAKEEQVLGETGAKGVKGELLGAEIVGGLELKVGGSFGETVSQEGLLGEEIMPTAGVVGGGTFAEEVPGPMIRGTDAKGVRGGIPGAEAIGESRVEQKGLGQEVEQIATKAIGEANLLGVGAIPTAGTVVEGTKESVQMVRGTAAKVVKEGLLLLTTGGIARGTSAEQQPRPKLGGTGSKALNGVELSGREAVGAKTSAEERLGTLVGGQDEAGKIVKRVARATEETKTTLPRKPSVIMFGLDTMSRINLRRTMPNVYKFLTQSGWYEMQGYNKVADNTFPNLLAILSGYSPETAKSKVCDTDKRGCLDRFPFIWKYLKKAGYLTAYAEDAYFINTFRLHKPGFIAPPTDYFHLPFLEAFDKSLKTSKCPECTMDYCFGRRIQSSYIFDYMKDYAKRYLNDRPIWGLFWSSSFTHDDFSLASKMDNYILQYLKDFQTDGVLDQYIIIFFSDHGARFGELRQLSDGYLESRLPMLFIHLPPWFRAQYPEYVKALELNRNRLTSNYDLHNTLKHIIDLGGLANDTTLPKSEDCTKCQSLFHAVDPLRSCVDAGIPEHYCTCEPYKAFKANWTDRISELIIERINEFLSTQNLSSRCEDLHLSLTQTTEVKIGLNMKFHSDIPKMDIAQYRITFIVKESGAIFFATVVYNTILDQVEVDVASISRLNEYVLDSHCVADKLAKLFCICKNKLIIPPVMFYRKKNKFNGVRPKSLA